MFFIAKSKKEVASVFKAVIWLSSSPLDRKSSIAGKMMIIDAPPANNEVIP
ncbi:hypothetical protein SDC9_182559 [bioreactor metagenome]|uniref:Uncharacterized protein n=1 Tax=bioreactor metagenome TaxID=1076179 RepID=A0A645H7V3_9ZZZZ